MKLVLLLSMQGPLSNNYGDIWHSRDDRQVTPRFGQSGDKPLAFTLSPGFSYSTSIFC